MCAPGKRLAPKITFGAFMGTTLVDFRWIWDENAWIWASFSMDFGCFSAAAFAECQSRLARNEITENVKNMQITAEICKHQAQTKNKSPKRRSIICRLQNANSCTKRRSPNTGAAVLAPHGAFGSAAPVSQSGVPEACRTLLPI